MWCLGGIIQARKKKGKILNKKEEGSKNPPVWNGLGTQMGRGSSS